MRHISEIFIVLLIVSTISAVDKKTIAVLDLDAEGVSPQEAGYLTRRIRHELFRTDHNRPGSGQVYPLAGIGIS